MPFVFIEAHNVRILEHVVCAPHPQINVVTGANASGKSSFLEAVGFLSLGRSFRTQQLEPVVRKGQKSLQIFGRFVEGQVEHRVGIERSRQGKKIKLDDNSSASAAQLAETIPLLALNPDSHRVFFAEAPARREALAWSLFHVEPRFLSQWRTYMRLLKQRNAALRAGKGWEAWERELGVAGESLSKLYQSHLETLLVRWRKWCEALIALAPAITYEQGWQGGISLAEALKLSREMDRERGFTRVGPHRADVSVVIEGQPGRAIASHGQQKLMLLAFRFAQVEMAHEVKSNSPVLLIDDLPTDLDRTHREAVVRTLEQLPTQSFVTATEPELLPNHKGKMFHVEQGRFSEIS